MGSGVVSGFVFGACLGVIGLAALSQMSPLPPGPAPVVPAEAPAMSHLPAAEGPPAVPGGQTAP